MTNLRLSVDVGQLENWSSLTPAQQSAARTKLANIPGEGVKISELPRIDTLAVEDLFIFGKSNSASYSISKGDLADKLEADISAGLGVKSMAYRDVAEYAPADHTHLNMYTKLDTGSWNAESASVSDRFPDAADYVAVAQLSVWNEPYYSNNDTHEINEPSIKRIYVPIVAKPSLPPVPIGTLKFVGKKTLGNINVNAADFDGWVYPDGTTYSVGESEFRSACAVYGGGEGATSFTVPNLRHFFRCNPSGVSHTSGNNSGLDHLIAHSHGFTDGAKLAMSGTATLNSGSQIKTTKDFGGTTADHVHNGKGDMTASEYACTIDASSISLTGSLVTSSAGSGGESHPSYNMLPVLVYIGLKN